MPGRPTPLVTEEIYHVFNRGIDHRPIFTDKKEHTRFLDLLKYYRFFSQPVRFSHFILLSNERQNELLLQQQSFNKKLISLLSFCLMPNHFHLLLKQTEENGISKFLSNLQNSYTRYFNIKNERDGSLLLTQFKAVRIETQEQLIHVSRYIHLNPHTSYVVSNLANLPEYTWSSFNEYLNGTYNLVDDKDTVLSSFKNPTTYRDFVNDQADYQRQLDKIKHVLLED